MCSRTHTLDSGTTHTLHSGTNAYTDVHHTAYTLTTAGSEGTLALLPVFLDHVLRPKITASGFITEVYHVDGDGEEKGVVFSEMQAIENESGNVAYVALRKLLYPGPCGYAMETGGVMADIRTLTVEQIRQYHKDYYRPDNMFIIVTGTCSTADVLTAVDKMRHKISDDERRVSTRQPRPFFVHPVPPLCASVDKIVTFPAEEEDSGCVMIGWRGRDFNDFSHSVTLSILHAYLSDSEVSILHRHFVQGAGGADRQEDSDSGHDAEEDEEESDVDEGDCAAVSCGLCEYGHTFHYVAFDSVRVSAIDSIKDRLLRILRDLTENGLDMVRMASVIDKFHIRHLNSLEDSPHDTLAHYITHALLFAPQPQDAALKLAAHFSDEALAPIKALTSDDWVALIKEAMLDPPLVCVHAVPSSARAADLASDNARRLQQRRAALGPDGLRKLQDRLDAALAENDEPVPDQILREFQIPSVDSISLVGISTAIYPPSARAARQEQTRDALGLFAQHHALTSDAAASAAAQSAETSESLPLRLHQLSAAASAGCGGQVTEEEVKNMGMYVQLDDVASDFIELRVVLNTAFLSDSARQYLELYLEACFSLPVERRAADGSVQQVGWEVVVQELQDDLVHYGNSIGIGGGNFTCGAFSQMMVMSFKSQRGAERFRKTVQLAREITFDSVFTPDRLAVAANNLLNDVSERKREGEMIAQAGLREMLYCKSSSNHCACNLVRQTRFLSSVVARLQTEADVVVAEMEALRAALTTAGTIMLQVVGNMSLLAKEGLHPLRPIIDLFGLSRTAVPEDAVTQPGEIRLARQVHSNAVTSPSGVLKVLSMPAIESSFLYCAARGLPSFQHADTAAMLVAIEILTCIEGPLWNLIRGQGLAYSFSMYGDADEGLVYFSLSRSPCVIKAYNEARRLVQAFAGGECRISDTDLENGIASVLSSVVSRESTVGQCGMQSLMTALRRSGPGHNSRLLTSIAAVSASHAMHGHLSQKAIVTDSSCGKFQPLHSDFLLVGSDQDLSGGPLFAGHSQYLCDMLPYQDR